MPDNPTSNLAALVGRNIVNRRRKLGMSQDQLAECLNMSCSSLSRIENGLSSPRFGRLEDLAKHLECSVADLFRDEQESLTVRLEAIEDMLRPLQPQTQEDVVNLIGSAVRMFNRTNHKQGKP